MMKLKILKFLAIACWSLLPGLLFAQKSAIERFVQLPINKHASIGFKLVDIETGKLECAYNENMSLCPASVLKIITTASALEILGKDFLFETKIYSQGNIDEKGCLHGKLFIQGSGDPSLGSEYVGDKPKYFLQEWLEAINKAGIKSIQGILVNKEPEAYEGFSSKWLKEDLGNYYASGTYNISVFDNSYRLYLRSEKAGTEVQIIKTEPLVDLKFNNYLKVVSSNIDSAYIAGAPFSMERNLHGVVPQNKNSIIIKGDIPKPALFLANYFEDFLKSNHISISSKAESTESPPDTMAKLLCTSVSKPMAQLIRVSNERSNNHYAEHLFYAIGKERGLAKGSDYIPSISQRQIHKYWHKKGINTQSLFMYDGSGLAPSNAISAQMLTEVLVYMYKKSVHKEIFLQSLPLAGKEGTVRAFLKNTPLEGEARIKSGSISKVQSYAGYVMKDGKASAFTLIVNNFTGNRKELRKEIERLLLSF